MGCSPECKLECPEGQIVEGHCYFFLKQEHKGSEVRGKLEIDECKGPSAHIADFLTLADLADVYTALGSAASGALISMKFEGNSWERQDFSKWSWFELGTTTLDLWAPDRPNASKDFTAPDPCGALLQTVEAPGLLRLDDTDCDSLRKVVCEREPVCIVNGRKGFVGRNGHCYFTVGGKKWNEIGAACGDGAALAAFETAAERDGLGGIGFGDTWLSGQQAGNKGKPAGVDRGWQWVGPPGTPAIPITGDDARWSGNEPNDSNGTEDGSEDCLQLFKTRTYNDQSCTDRSLEPLCEYVPKAK